VFDSTSFAQLEDLMMTGFETGQAAPGVDVTVVIPTHGRPELLKRAIFSALGQTHYNLEVVVVIDGHDPKTVEAVSWIKDPRLSLIALDSPVGGAQARNIGARAAKGYYIALLDDDDEWLPDKIAKQIAVGDESATDRFVVVTRYLYRLPGQADEVWPGHLPSANEPLSEFLFSSCGGFQTSTYLCPRALFLAHPFTPGLKKHQDWDWFLQLSTLPGFEVLIVPEPLSIYWVPLRSRSSVSGKLDWRFSASWAKRRLPAMTRKAYSTFLVKICLRGAFIQKEGLQALRLLLRELFVIGRPTPLMLGDFAASVLIPENVRVRLRYGLMRLRRS
jgi:glycosyltransferase involved in cell wall biosynthesis